MKSTITATRVEKAKFPATFDESATETNYEVVATTNDSPPVLIAQYMADFDENKSAIAQAMRTADNAIGKEIETGDYSTRLAKEGEIVYTGKQK